MGLATYARKPACFSNEISVNPPVLWAFDGGKSCGGARTPELWEKLLSTTPGCIQGGTPCAKAVRSALINSGSIQPFVRPKNALVEA
jgi:hypothetical protein